MAIRYEAENMTRCWFPRFSGRLCKATLRSFERREARRLLPRPVHVPTRPQTGNDSHP